MIQTFASADDLAKAVAGRWLDEIAVAGVSGEPLTVALSGGRITKQFFNEVVAQSQARHLTLERVHFFWADERCLPPTDPESNYRLANERLFGPLQIGAGQIHRLQGEADPETAAREASAEILRIAPANAAGLPVLFPGAGPEVRDVVTPFLVVRNSPKPPPTRLSLSYAAIAAARQVWVLASGAGKEQSLRDSLVPGGLTPLGRVLGLRAESQVFTDLKSI